MWRVHCDSAVCPTNNVVFHEESPAWEHFFTLQDQGWSVIMQWQDSDSSEWVVW